jgi:hypothetical protein
MFMLQASLGSILFERLAGIKEAAPLPGRQLGRIDPVAYS